MGEPVVGRVTFEPPRDSGTYETLRRECGVKGHPLSRT